jgi:hypothetical protein
MLQEQLPAEKGNFALSANRVAVLQQSLISAKSAVRGLPRHTS